jgi:hypothetical protein
VRPTQIAAAVALALAALLDRGARACSCFGPRPALVSPGPDHPAPVTSRVRALVPIHRAAGATVVLRPPGGAPVAVATASRSMGGVDLVELTPSAPLAPDTRYEIALHSPGQYPSTFVFGTFRTGATRDVKAPRIDAIGVAGAHANPGAMSSMCQSADTVVTLDGISVSDPDRDGAEIALGVWIADAAGRVDTKKLPVYWAVPKNGHVQLGRTSICDPRELPLPNAPAVTLGVAAIDESGNTSPVKLVRVALPPARHP